MHPKILSFLESPLGHACCVAVGVPLLVLSVLVLLVVLLAAWPYLVYLAYEYKKRQLVVGDVPPEDEENLGL